jgi:inner membrane protein
MFLFGHVGITLGAGLVLDQTIKYGRRLTAGHSRAPNTPSIEHNDPVKASPIATVSLIEIVFCVIGSVLPDIIDKPVGHYLFSQFFGNNGRIFSHTLLFALIILIIGLWWYFSKKVTWGLILSFGVFMHLILDSMWRTPQTLFWPLYGFSFPRSNETGWFWGMIHNLIVNPSTYIEELVGIAILVIVLAVLIWAKRISIYPRRKRKTD